MRKQHSQNQKQDIVNRYFNGEGVDTLSEETGISRSAIYSWVKVERQLREKKAAEKEAVNFKSYNQLKEHAERLEGMLAILKTCGCAPHDPLSAKLNVCERLYNEDKYSVRLICEALDVPRGTFYNHVLQNKRGESMIRAEGKGNPPHFRVEDFVLLVPQKATQNGGTKRLKEMC